MVCSSYLNSLSPYYSKSSFRVSQLRQNFTVRFKKEMTVFVQPVSKSDDSRCVYEDQIHCATVVYCIKIKSKFNIVGQYVPIKSSPVKIYRSFLL